MKTFQMKMGKKIIELNLNEKNLLGLIKPNDIDNKVLTEKDILEKLDNPICSKPLKDIVNNNDKIAIITSDITRPFPNKVMLPILLNYLHQYGVSKENIKIIFALGSHRKHTEDEIISMVGEEIYNSYKCIDSDPNDVVCLGYTKNNTPVEFFKDVVEAKIRILLGNIEFHYFAGYSGGLKAMMPGVSTRKAIQQNHKLMLDKKAIAGNIIDNPVRNDIDEILNFIDVQFIINLVLDEKKNIIGCFTGHPIHAHREGCKFLDSFYKVNVDKLADVAFISCGGFPKDINLYQAQKAIDNSKYVVKKGGTIVLFASCQEGYGEGVFEHWINEANNPDDLIERVKTNFELGGHKAAALATVIKDIDIIAVSDMPNQMLNKIFIKKIDDLESLFSYLKEKHGDNFKAYVIPYASSILPYYNGRND
ncbi:nickel-dependent lactate racemase [Caldicellulosiruptoraceae bacterium PP1]